MESNQENSFPNILIRNLLRIYQSENESMRADDFELGYYHRDEVLRELIEMDLIETDGEADLYFLSPEAYELIENGNLDFYLDQNLSLSYLLNVRRADDEDEYLVTEAYLALQQEERSKPKTPAYLYAIPLIIIVFYLGRNKKETIDPPFKPGGNLIIINQNGDTISGSSELIISKALKSIDSIARIEGKRDSTKPEN